MMSIGTEAVAEKHAESKRQAYHLPAQTPYPTTDRAHVVHEPRRGPRSAEFNHGAARPGDADVQRCEADG